ncbi:MAG: hypothetical protein UX30_C0002G0044 [Candidatus Saccharibacteria bacterium GW2011_GWA2_46_10]|nr:MAG: hypothetical protein UX30_C0002G0044 [Candidatus Saccharibacteria bacterium GW2011_GWA2_46_10]
MHEGKVVHFEDDLDWQRVVQFRLGNSAHKLVAQASSSQEAMDVLERMHRGEIDANLVILGGSLTKGSRTGAHDSQLIMGRIKELDLPVRTIGLSAHEMSYYGIEVDADVGKGHGARNLVEVIDGLPEPQSQN